eukprot:symbB.v1.2.022665.t1/scaffold2021.1/size93746/7
MSVVASIIFVVGNGELWAKTGAFSPTSSMEWTQDPDKWEAADIMTGLKRRRSNQQVVSFVQKFGKVVLAEGDDVVKTLGA